jgi:hypothetical protein
MKKALIIIAVVLVPILIYIGIVLYVAYQLNYVPKPYSQALIDVQKPSFTIDWFDDESPLPTITTTAQAEEDGSEITVSDVYNSGYSEPFDYTME